MIEVNGELLALEAAVVAELIAELGFAAESTGIAVAVNGEVVPRGSWGERSLEDGDRVEIVGAVQGG